MGFPLPETYSPCFTERLWPSHWELIFSHLDCPNFRQQTFVDLKKKKKKKKFNKTVVPEAAVSVSIISYKYKVQN